MGTMFKDDFIHEIAKRAGFTIGDTRISWKAVEEQFKEAVEMGYEIDIYGFGRLYYVEFPERENTDFDGNRVVMPRAKKVLFSLGHNIRDLLRPPKKRKIQTNKKVKCLRELDDES